MSASATPRRDWQRARIVLMASEGLSSPVIGEAVGLNRNQVDVWRRRYIDGGVDALADRPRSGRPRVYGPKERLALVKTITARPAEPGRLGRGRLRARMSMPEVARRLREHHGIAISDSQVWRICRSLDLKPWQVRSWLASHDPDFDEKAVDVCGLYLEPEDNWAVFSVDEKTAIQARRAGLTSPRAPRAALHRRQPRHPRNKSRRGVPRRPPSHLLAPHPHPRIVAQPDRDVVLDPHPPTPRHSRVQPHQRLRRSHPRLHRRLQQPSPTLQMDIPSHPQPHNFRA